MDFNMIDSTGQLYWKSMKLFLESLWEFTHRQLPRLLEFLIFHEPLSVKKSKNMNEVGLAHSDECFINSSFGKIPYKPYMKLPRCPMEPLLAINEAANLS